MIWKIWSNSMSNSDKKWTIQKKGKLKCEMICTLWKKDKLNSEKI